MKQRAHVVNVAVAVCAIAGFHCAPVTTAVSASPESNPLTDECRLRDEVCAEALDFQREYDRMPEEEQKDMKSVATTYAEHCEEAMLRCKKSLKKK
jgi:hypothetical protein